MIRTGPNVIRALLWDSRRSSERHNVERLSTVRNEGIPSDVAIDNLSLTGFHLSGISALMEGDVINIGLAGVGIREARVVWTGEDAAGCSFSIPITTAEFEQTISANTVIPAVFGPEAPAPAETVDMAHADQIQPARNNPARFLVALFIGWACVVALGYAIFSLSI